jgi:hypothetical protein
MITSEQDYREALGKGQRNCRLLRTHLLLWGCHTIMELVFAALPVETTGALVSTGATAQRAAILNEFRGVKS